MFSGVIDELVNFRIKVRNYARAMPEATEVESTMQSQEAKLEEKEKRQLLLLEREPLLQACDNLRRDLAAFGINIKVQDTILSLQDLSVVLLSQHLFPPFTCPLSTAFSPVPCTLHCWDSHS